LSINKVKTGNEMFLSASSRTNGAHDSSVSQFIRFLFLSIPDPCMITRNR